MEDSVLDDLDEIINQLDSPESGYQSPERPSDRLNEFYKTYSGEIMPHLEILVQPQELYRFRYITEFKDNPHGPLTGQNSSKSNKTFPTIRLNKYNRKAIIRCWLCVNSRKDVHVHQLLTKNDGRGIRCEPHDIVVDVRNNFTAVFEGLNIIHAVIKGKEYLECFHKKKAHLKSGFVLDLKNFPFDQRALQAEVKTIEKNKAVLFFEAFDFETKEKIDEIFSHEIKNSKNPKTSTLKIARQSHKYGGASGGTEVFIFVEKVTKDIKVVFYELGLNGEVVWEDAAIVEEFWHQVAIAFRTPAYKNVNIEEEKKVYFKLVRESDTNYSNEMEFLYQPEYRNQANYTEPVISKKRRYEEININSYSPNSISEYSTDSNPGQYNLEESVVVLNDVKLLTIPVEQCPPADPSTIFPGFVEDQFYNNMMIPGATLVDPNNFEEQMELPTIFDSDSAGLAQPPPSAYEFDGIFKDGSSKDTSHIKKMDNFSLLRNLMKYISDNSIPRLFHETLNEIKRRNIKITDSLRNVYDKTPLQMAVEKGKVQYLKPLLEAGFHINAIDIDHNSVLHLAVKYETRAFIIDYLLEVNANANLKNCDGDTALHMACRRNKLSFVKSLINKTDINSQCKKGGNTPLHIVAKCGHKEVANILLEAGAKMDVKNYANLTPFDCAVENENVDLVRLFLAKMDVNDRKNIYLIEEKLDSVENKKVYDLLEAYLKSNSENSDFQSVKNDEEINLCNNLIETCTINEAKP